MTSAAEPTSAAGLKSRRSLAKLSRAAEGKFVATRVGGGSARAQGRARSASADGAGGGRKSPAGAERDLAPIVNKSASGKGVSIRFSDVQLASISTEPGVAVAASPAQISAVSQRLSSTGGVSYTFDIEESSATGGGDVSDGAAADVDGAASAGAFPDVALGAQPTLPRPDAAGCVVVGTRSGSAPLHMAFANEVGSAIASSCGGGERAASAAQRREAALRPAVAASAFGWFARSAVGDLFAPPSAASSGRASSDDTPEQRSRKANHDDIATRADSEPQGVGGGHAANPAVSPSPSPSPSSPGGDCSSSAAGGSPSIVRASAEGCAESRRDGRPLLARDVAIGCRFLPNVRVRSVSCGATGALLLTSACELWGWGVNAHGEMGFGDELPRRRAEPLPRPWAVGAPLGAREPVSIVCGYAHSVVATASGVYTAGRNARGCLGRDVTSATPRARFAPVDVLAALAPGMTARVVDTAAGVAHTVIAVQLVFAA